MKSLFPFFVNDVGILKKYMGFAKEITIPKQVKCIGDYAFMDNHSVERIYVPDGVRIEEQAFQSCKALKEIRLPDDCLELCYGTFMDCHALEEVHLPNGLKVLGGSVFNSCKSLKSISLPPTLRKIGQYAFKSCTKLENISLPDGLKVIEQGAFLNCVSLKRIVIPQTVTEIGRSAFQNCFDLVLTDINPETTLVAPDAFSGCPSEILPEKLLHERESEFYFEGDTLARCCTGKKKHIVLPENTREISASAFSDVGGIIQSVVIPDGVVTIRSTTFLDCHNLVSVTLPESIRSIKSRAFTNCVRLKKLNFPEKLVDIAPNAFDNCPFLKIPEKVIRIMQNPPACSTAMAFRNIPDTTMIIRNVILQGGIDVPRKYRIPETFAISDGAFMFFGFTEVVLPEGMEIIGDGAFTFCDEMTKIVLPSTLKAIGKKAFSCCSSLKIINFPESLEYIGENAFEKCTALKLPSHITNLIRNPINPNYRQITHDPAGLEFPDVPVIRDNVLYRGGKSLGISAVIPNGIEAVGKGAFMFADIRKVFVPHGVTFIGASAFAFCKNLEEVVLPDTLVKIAETAFFGCQKLTTVDIPESVEYISADAFQECDNVELNSHAVRLMNTQNELYELIATFHSSHMDCELLQNNIVHVVFTEEFNIDVDLTNYIIFLHHKTEGNLKIDCQNMDGIKKELSLMPCRLYL